MSHTATYRLESSMRETLIFCLGWLLRVFGAFWLLGGAFTLQQARNSYFFDYALASISSQKADRFESHFMMLCGLLTLLSGAGFLIATRWVLLALCLLVSAQGLYFVIQRRRFVTAATKEQQNDASISPATQNAFLVSLGVTLLALVGQGVGVLR